MQSWGYLCGLLRAERVHTLTDNEFVGFAEMQDAESVFKALEDTSYGALFQDRHIREFTQIFGQYYKAKYSSIREMAPDQTILNVHALRHDLNNLKLLYKAKLVQREVAWEKLSEEGTISPEKMFSIVENELYNELPIVVANAVIICNEQGSELNPRSVDFLLDKAYYGYRLEILKEAANRDSKQYAVLFDFYRKEIDCENIKNIFRAKKMDLSKESVEGILINGGYISPEYFLDQINLSAEDTADLVRDTMYGTFLDHGISFWQQTKSCTILEKQIDEYLLQQAKNFSYLSEGPAVIEETLRTMDIELKNLKLIIIGKLNSMNSEEIKERVRHVGS